MYGITNNKNHRKMAQMEMEMHFKCFSYLKEGGNIENSVNCFIGVTCAGDESEKAIVYANKVLSLSANYWKPDTAPSWCRTFGLHR